MATASSPARSAAISFSGPDDDESCQSRVRHEVRLTRAGQGQDCHAMGGIRKHGPPEPLLSILWRGGSTPIRDCSKLRLVGKSAIHFSIAHQQGQAHFERAC